MHKDTLMRELLIERFAVTTPAEVSTESGPTACYERELAELEFLAEVVPLTGDAA